MKKIIILSLVLLVATSLCVQQEVETYEEACTPEWICGDWGETCLNYELTRDCEDLNACDTDDGKPEGTKYCEVYTDITSLHFLLLTSKNSNPNRDGLDSFDFKLAPKDAKGSTIKQAGTVDIKLWLREYDDENQAVKGDLVDEWFDIEIAEDDYEYTGVYVSASFDEDFTPDPSDYAFLEVTLTTTEGAKIVETKENFLLGRQVFY
ncbi:MAG: hypothetical protein GOV02_02505 [Candidatus Aenigmarchaeota archaeon]|nr:hypothetical protein [Candidatus Aenigmarchaeota archaeon]